MSDDNFTTFSELLRNTEKCYLYAPVVHEAKQDINLSPPCSGRRDQPNIEDFNVVDMGNNKISLNKEAVIRYLRACRVVYDGRTPYLYDGRIYRKTDEDHIADFIYRSINQLYDKPFLSRSTVSDLIAYLRAVSQVEDIEVPEGWDEEGRYEGELVPFQNGLYNIDTDELLGFTPYIFITYQLAAFYNPKVTEDKAEECLTKIIPDEETRDFFYQLAGYTMFSSTLSPPGLFCIYGPGGTGKSAIDQMMRATIGNENISNLKPHQISSEFMTIDLKDKILNISGETGKGKTNSADVDGELLKQLSDGQMIQANQKHKNSMTFQNTAKMWYITNQLPDFGDTSSGMYRRVYIIPCRQIQQWSDQLYTHMTTFTATSWLVNKAMKAYREFIARGRTFVISDLMLKESRSYRVQDALGEYLESRYGTFQREALTEELDGVMVDEIYRDYQEYVRDGGGKPLSRRGLSEKLRNEYRLESKKIRVMQDNGRPTNRIKLVKIGTS